MKKGEILFQRPEKEGRRNGADQAAMSRDQFHGVYLLVTAEEIKAALLPNDSEMETTDLFQLRPCREACSI